MRALTIHQPYAYLIVTPQAELPDGAYNKRVENRTWHTNVRGELAIHAGMSLKWLDHEDWPAVPDDLIKKLKFSDFPEFAFGAIVGLAEIIDCYSIEQIRRGDLSDRMMWLQSHRHVSGPYCFVLDNIRRLSVPVPCVGKQGFWTVDSDTSYTVLSTTSVGVQRS